MAMKIRIDGREFDFPVLDTMTFREAKLVKKATGLKMGQYAEALEDGDVDMLLAMALIAKLRADGIVDTEKLLDMPIDKLEVFDDEVPEDDDEEAEQSPPAEAAEAAADVAAEQPAS